MTKMDPRPGTYRVFCDETFIMACANGHSSIWPEARAIVKKDWAYIYKGRRRVWSCNSTYLMANFRLEKWKKPTRPAGEDENGR